SPIHSTYAVNRHHALATVLSPYCVFWLAAGRACQRSPVPGTKATAYLVAQHFFEVAHIIAKLHAGLVVRDGRAVAERPCQLIIEPPCMVAVRADVDTEDSICHVKLKNRPE